MFMSYEKLLFERPRRGIKRGRERDPSRAMLIRPPCLLSMYRRVDL